MNNKLRSFIPPIVLLAARKMAEALRLRKATTVDASEAIENLRWCPIQSGPLVGRSLYMNPEARAYQGTMLQGTFDRFLFDYIDRTNWSGKVIYDIGAHIGYHTLNFAHRVGLEGRVFSFEPHPLHLERLKVNLSRNTDLAARVTLMPIAVSNNAGYLEFFCTESVEGGGSSASFIEGASTPFPRSNYTQYQAIQVEAARLDDLVTAGRCLPPDLMKIDVEGAESLVIEGALDTLRKYKPIILMEVHSLPNMLHVTTLLLPLGYSFDLLKEEDRRCFVAAEPSDPTAEQSGGVSK
jgi:FkbM family methyltransferase